MPTVSRILIRFTAQAGRGVDAERRSVKMRRGARRVLDDGEGSREVVADRPLGQAQLDAQKPIRDVNMERAEGFTELERIAIWVTDRVGTMQCFFLIAIWTAFWHLIQLHLMR